jgi:hypothetical protein
MNTVTLSDMTYQLLQRKAQESTQTPDQIADQLLREMEHLLPTLSADELKNTVRWLQEFGANK